MYSSVQPASPLTLNETELDGASKEEISAFLVSPPLERSGTHESTTLSLSLTLVIQQWIAQQPLPSLQPPQGHAFLHLPLRLDQL